ncbi:MAG: hypothetical protein ACPGJV_03545 [Bacteriovoracaceae bacterium]
MPNDYWFEVWERETQGFQQAEVNAYLKQYLSEIIKTPGHVLVPLCGKSLDILFLRNQGHEVLGVDLVESPLISFFEENQILYKKESHQYLSEDAKIKLHAGDFLKFNPGDHQNFDLIYDRASLIALEKPLRLQYLEVIKSVLAKGAKLFLLTLERDTHREGPPWDITKKDIQNYFPNENYKCNLITEERKVLKREDGPEMSFTNRLHFIEEA